MHQIKAAIAKDWKCFPDFIDQTLELYLISEIDKILGKQRWNDTHLDAVIYNYREIMVDEFSRLPVLDKFMKAKVRPIFQKIKKTMLPVHILELNRFGFVRPHIDNPNVQYNGPRYIFL